jgi:hypothetical protein
MFLSIVLKAFLLLQDCKAHAVLLHCCEMPCTTLMHATCVVCTQTATTTAAAAAAAVLREHALSDVCTVTITPPTVRYTTVDSLSL